MGDHLKYWEGTANFAWAESTIEVFVDRLAQDDMEQQHEFFRKVSQEWPTLYNAINDLLEQEWRQRNTHATANFEAEAFVVSSMSIPKGDIDRADWEVSLTATFDIHLYTVGMKGRKPIRVIVE